VSRARPEPRSASAARTPVRLETRPARVERIRRDVRRLALELGEDLHSCPEFWAAYAAWRALGDLAARLDERDGAKLLAGRPLEQRQDP